MPEEKRPLKVFLSHAHSDADAVRALYDRLTADGVDAWLDREKLLPGQDWELEIRKAVREADVVVVCLSKQFNQAGYRQKEVRLALDAAMERPEGEIFIIPARLEECDTIENLRKWQWIDLFEENGYEMLVRFLNARDIQRTVIGDVKHYSSIVPFQAPPLPPNFIARPTATNTLKRILFENPLTEGQISVVAIHGMGGIGKSSLASVLSHELFRDQHFRDGVLWTELGQHPDLLSLLTRWIHDLGDYGSLFNSVEIATTRLRSLLKNKEVLLVVDNAWEADHVKPFLAGTPCKVIITTRRANVAEAVGALGSHFYELDVMRPDEATTVLTRPLGRQLSISEIREAEELASSLGYLPLALQLAAARLAHGTSFSELRQALEREIANLEILEGARAENKLEAVFNLSLNALRDEFSTAFQAYLWLAIIKENSSITAPMASIIWEEGETEAARLLDLLWNDALLMPGLSINIGIRSFPAYHIHDLLHSFIRRLLIYDQPEGSGIASIQSAHEVLLNRYRSHIRDDKWHTLPVDGYIHTNLTWHMEKAHQTESIHILLSEETDNGQNGWFTACDSNGLIASYISDVKRAWTIAEKDTNHLMIGLQCRYALIVSSIRSLAQKMSPSLVLSLINSGVWTSAQGLIYSRYISPLDQRAKALALITPYLPEQLHEEILSAALETKDHLGRVWALSGIAINLEKRLQETAWRAALDASKKISDSSVQVQILVELGSKMPISLSKMAQQDAILLSIKTMEPNERAKSLLYFAHKMAERRYEQESLQALYAFGLRGWLVIWPYGFNDMVGDFVMAIQKSVQSLLRSISDFRKAIGLEKEIFDPIAAEIIRTQSDRDDARSIFRDLISNLSSKIGKYGALLISIVLQLFLTIFWMFRLGKGSVIQLIGHILLKNAILIDQSIIEETSETVTLREILDLPIRKLGNPHEELEKARRIGDLNDQVKALASCLSKLSTDQIRELLIAVRSLESDFEKAKSVVFMAPYLPEQLLQEFTSLARSVKSAETRNAALTALDTRTTILSLEKAKTGETREAINLARGIGANDVKRQADALFQIIPYLPQSFIKEGLETALIAIRKVPDTQYRVTQLAALMPYLKDRSLLDEAINSAMSTMRTIEETEQLVTALALITPCLPVDRQRDALLVARSVTNEEDCAKVLATLPQYLQGPLRHETAIEVCNMLSRIESQEKRAYMVDQISYIVAEYDQEQALKLVGSIVFVSLKDKIKDFIELLAIKLNLYKEISSQQKRLRKQLDVLSTLTPHLTKPWEDKAVKLWTDTANLLRDPILKTKAFVALAPYSPFDDKQEILTKVLALNKVDEKARELVILAQYLPEKIKDLALQNAFNAVLTVEEPRQSTNLMLEIYPALPTLIKNKALIFLLENVVKIKDLRHRLQTLKSIATCLPESKDEIKVILNEIVQKNKALEDRNKYWEEIILLLLDLGNIDEALGLVSLIEKPEDRGKVLAILIPKLVIFPLDELPSLWCDILHELAYTTRKELLSDISFMIPIAVLLEQNASNDIYQAIKDVGRWWP